MHAEAVFTADYESEGGERFASRVGEGMQYRLEMLRESGARQSVTVGGAWTWTLAIEPGTTAFGRAGKRVVLSRRRPGERRR